MTAAVLPSHWRHDSHSQSYRAALQGRDRRAEVAPRDRAIVRALRTASQRAVAAALGVSRRTVRGAAARLALGARVRRCDERACGRPGASCAGRGWHELAAWLRLPAVTRLKLARAWASRRLSASDRPAVRGVLGSWIERDEETRADGTAPTRPARTSGGAP